ncbi:MAG: MBL fold metallo-hydrolase, partial [Spirochaetales bacterium]|nr:MBL fold metallo-hydrolase [Spirochaetales bacterium]
MAKDILKQLGQNTWVLEGPTNIGFIENNGKVYLIDSGNDKDFGRRINKLLKEKGWSLEAVVNTHSNADHIGGNDYLQRNLDCEIYSSAIESAFVEYPELESAFLWGGKIIKDMDNKFFKAKSSKVTKIIDTDSTICDGLLKTIAIPGHYFNMIGIETPDKVIFLGDCIFGENILEKYKIPFIYDVKAYKETLEKIKNIQADYYV